MFLSDVFIVEHDSSFIREAKIVQCISVNKSKSEDYNTCIAQSSGEFRDFPLNDI